MIVAERYAKSLMELASSSGQLEKAREDMKLIINVYEENHEFTLFLDSPLIKTDKKISILNSIFKGKVSDLSMSFITLLAKNRRESIIREIAKAFEEQYKKNKNILSAVITSAKGLDNTTKLKVAELIRAQLNAEVELNEKIDASTIGGFMLTIGDKQLDKTVARQLSDMKKQLVNKDLN
jgi:F-type H+-transporting ATPase subunit delta